MKRHFRPGTWNSKPEGLCSLPSSSLPPQDPRVAFFEASVHRPLTSVQGFGQLPPSYLIPVSHQRAARQLLLSLWDLSSRDHSTHISRVSLASPKTLVFMANPFISAFWVWLSFFLFLFLLGGGGGDGWYLILQAVFQATADTTAVIFTLPWRFLCRLICLASGPTGLAFWTHLLSLSALFPLLTAGVSNIGCCDFLAQFAYGGQSSLLVFFRATAHNR